MDISIVEVKDSKKGAVAEEVMRYLPEWFGNEKHLLSL